MSPIFSASCCERPRERNQLAIALAVFDVAGTTVLDGDAVIDAMIAALASDDVRAPRGAVTAVMGMPKPMAIRQLLGSAETDGAAMLDARVDRIYRTFVSLVKNRYRHDPLIREADGAVDVFRCLRLAGIRVALDTGFSRDVLDVLLARLGWDSDIVDCTVTSDEVEKGRPHPDMIFRAMELTGVTSRDDVAKIGDTPVDILEGQAARCGLVVGVAYGTHSRAELERFGVPVIDRLAELLPLVTAV
jgi:phosphonatase-like hydrolase